jgi:hypothetical protein
MLDKRSSTAHAALRAGAGTATKAVTAVAAAEGTLPAARRRDEADASANEADNGALRASKGAVATRRRRAEEPEMSMDDLPQMTYEIRLFTPLGLTKHRQDAGGSGTVRRSREFD